MLNIFRLEIQGVLTMGRPEMGTPPSVKKMKQARLPFAPVNKQGRWQL